MKNDGCAEFLNLMKEVDSANVPFVYDGMEEFGWQNSHFINQYFFPLFLHVTSQDLLQEQDFQELRKKMKS